MRRVPQGLEYPSRPKARTAHVGPARLAHQNPRFTGCRTSSAAFSRGSRTPVRIASGRLADENPRFSGKRNLMHCVPQDLEYSNRPKARTARIASRRLADENPRFSGMRNLA